jgi:hypothetical protein
MLVNSFLLFFIIYLSNNAIGWITNAWKAAGQPLVASTQSSWSLERQVRLVAGTLVSRASFSATSSIPAGSSSPALSVAALSSRDSPTSA